LFFSALAKAEAHAKAVEVRLASLEVMKNKIKN